MSFLKVVRFALSLSYLFLVFVTETMAQSRRPNVLFIVCDDLNTHVSTSGYPYTRTPAFEDLAAAGMTFHRAYCQYPVCGPSRASFLSGLYPQSTGILDNRSDIRDARPEIVSLPQSFKNAGYWTAAVGKVFHNHMDPGNVAWHQVLHFEDDELPLVTTVREQFEAEHGPITGGKSRKKWQEILPTIAPQALNQSGGRGPSGLQEEQHADGKNVRQISTWIIEQAYKDRPFFIACGIHKPHVPYLAPNKYFETYPRETLQFAPPSTEFWNHAPRIAQTQKYQEYGYELGVENAPLRREFIQAYHACISFIDAQIGLIFQALRQSGHWEDTIIVLTSDHGYLLGEKFMWGKVMLFEDCARVPFIIRVPASMTGVRTTAGSSSKGLVELIDLFPTLTELCDVVQPKNLQGRSLTSMLSDPEKAVGKAVAYTVVLRGQELGKAIRVGKWRYALWPDGKEELYDLDADPSENQCLVHLPHYAETLSHMRILLSEVSARAAQETVQR